MIRNRIDTVAHEASSFGSFLQCESRKFTFLAMKEGGYLILIKDQNIRRKVIQYYDRVAFANVINDNLRSSK